MAGQPHKKKFLEKFHELVRFYEKMHEEHEWKQTKIAVATFYGAFLQHFDIVFAAVINPRIQEKGKALRDKAVELSKFDERVTVHDLAEKMVQRLNDLGMALYSMPDIEYLIDSSSEIQVNMLLTCCPEFTHEQDKTTQKLCCKGTVKTVKFGLDQDIQPAVRLYYEKHCRDCHNFAAVQKQLALARSRVKDKI